MNNFEKFINNLTLEQFCDMMICNCDGCPNYPCQLCNDIIEGIDCYNELMRWGLNDR